MIEFPKILVVELPADKLVNPWSGKVSPDLINKALGLNFNGAVSADGEWIINPGTWVITKTGVGQYKVVHNLGYTNTAISVSLVEGLADIVVSHGTTEFTVDIKVNGEPADRAWMFSLSRVLSSPAQP